MKEKNIAQISKLRRARELRGWTQKALADYICLPDTRLLRRWESGEVIPSPRYRARLCEVFDMSAEELGILQENYPQITEVKEQPAESPALQTNEQPQELRPYTSEGQSQGLQPYGTEQHMPEQKTSITISREPASSSLPKQSINVRNRLKLLEKVNTFWINEILEQSLHGSMPLFPELRVLPDVVINPWDQIIHRTPQTPYPLPSDTFILQVYDRACGELLLLGEPGSGKTTLLLLLARDLLQRAFIDETHPIPVVLNLSSWSVKRLPLATWLVEELCDKYQVPRQLGRAWVESDHLLPLLDGLDEVNPALRELCVNTITTYRKEHGFVPLVVCSRKEEYLRLNTRLLLQQAVCIQPLTWHHIDLYLTNEGEWSRPLHAVLCDDESLQRLVTTPLMLSVLTVAYQGQSVEELKAPQSLEERRKHIFAMYVERMLTRRKPERRYTAQQSRRWLAYLAQQMLQHRQSEFSIDQIQLDWLPTDRSRSVCRGLIVGLEVGLAGALLMGLVAILLRHTVIGVAIAILCLAILLMLFVLFPLLSTGLLIQSFSKGLDDTTNQETLRSAYSAMCKGLAVGLLNWLVLTSIGIGAMKMFPSTMLTFVTILFGSLALSLQIAFIIALYKGGGAWLKHLAVRLMLYCGGYTPWNYLRFLDYATERILLHKTASGYMFVHQTLLEYFASL